LFSKGIIASGLFTETNDETTKEKELNLWKRKILKRR
jgi:hypothetical protein